MYNRVTQIKQYVHLHIPMTSSTSVNYMFSTQTGLQTASVCTSNTTLYIKAWGVLTPNIRRRRKINRKLNLKIYVVNLNNAAYSYLSLQNLIR